MSVQLFTIGFTGRNAEDFFTTLRKAGVKRVIDVRLNNTSQLAAFAKKDDLRFFLNELAGIDYVHAPELAPTQEILDTFKKNKGSWDVYEQQFNALIADRKIENSLPSETLDFGCLLCSEKEPTHCHRRLVAEYLWNRLGDISILHL